MGSILLISMNIGLLVLVILGGIFQYNMGKKRKNVSGFILPFIFFLLSLFVIGSEVVNDIIVYSQRSSEVLHTYRYNIGDNFKFWYNSLVTKYIFTIIVSNIMTITYLLLFLISMRRNVRNNTKISESNNKITID